MCSQNSYSTLAQSVELSAVNRDDVGSSPTGGGNEKACKRICLQAFFDFILWE